MTDSLPVQTNEEERIRATMSNGLDRLMNVSADRVFAEPVRIGDRVVIPAASVEFSGGFGFGGDHQSNGGGGGGGYQAGRPVAIIEAGPDGRARQARHRLHPRRPHPGGGRPHGLARLPALESADYRLPRRASSSSRKTSERIRLRQSARWRLSSSPWMFELRDRRDRSTARGCRRTRRRTDRRTGSTRPRPSARGRRRSRRAARAAAASNAGPVGSVCHAGAPSSAVNVQLEPPRHVLLDVRAQLRRARDRVPGPDRDAGSPAPTPRATIWFDDPLMGWPSIPITVRHGRSQSRSCSVTFGIADELARPGAARRRAAKRSGSSSKPLIGARSSRGRARQPVEAARRTRRRRARRPTTRAAATAP